VAVFVTRRERSEILVCHRSGPAGYWHTVAGEREPGETSAEGALRELREETGLVAELAGPATSLAYSLAEETAERRALYSPELTEVQVDCFLVDAPDGWEPLLDREHDGYRWCSPDDAFALLYWDDTSAALRRLLEGA
jgi:8-oxo-dGTP pyrophosphatase MutT (NUDIX family)